MFRGFAVEQLGRVLYRIRDSIISLTPTRAAVLLPRCQSVLSVVAELVTSLSVQQLSAKGHRGGVYLGHSRSSG